MFHYATKIALLKIEEEKHEDPTVPYADTNYGDFEDEYSE